MITVAKVPTCIGSMGRNRGCEKAPDEILNQLETVYYSESGKKPKIRTIKISVNENNPEETMNNISKSEADIYLGGDHSITYSAFRTMKSKDAGLIVFDAHPDLDSTTGTPTHEDYLRKLVEEKSINPENIILIGTRNYGDNELEFIKENRIKNFTARQIFEYGMRDIADSVTEIANRFKQMYLSVDIDVVDPSSAPGTGFPEPEGLQAREVLYLIQRIKLLKNLKKADIVEVNPEKDVNGMTSRLAARILMELL